jgi:Ni/Co efflux regulator RcnB
MRISALLVALCWVASSGTSIAGKPEWAGKGNKHQQQQEQEQDQPQQATVQVQIGGYFGERQRRVASDYYEAQGRSGKCPPGLAKKHNGCMPPGQAKKWKLGRPLERDVVFYPVPQEVVVRIGLPPAGYRYVRVLGDVLLVAIGTNMVVDAIEDLMRQR